MPQFSFDPENITARDAKVSRDRLLKLAALLAEIPTRRFNYDTWVGDGFKGAQDLSCGTTACALGWACTVPAFRKLGLELEVETSTRDEYNDKGDFVEVKSYQATPVCPSPGKTRAGNPKKLYAYEAGQEIFRLSEEQAGFLFTPGVEYGGRTGPGGDDEETGEERTATARQVARHIIKFVEKYRTPGKPFYAKDDENNPKYPEYIDSLCD